MNEKFFTVIRQFYKNGAETHSMEVKTSFEDALKRYFSIIATDLNDSDITYQAAYIVDSNGLMMEQRVFNRVAVAAQEEA